MDINLSRGIENGLTFEKLDALDKYAEDDRFTQRERLGIEFAERMTRTDMDVTDEFFASR